MRPGPSPFGRPDCSGANGTNPGRTHRFYTGKAVVPFGFGLSYTTFAYSASSSHDHAAALSLDPVRVVLAETEKAGRAFVASEVLAAAAPLVQYMVNVSNTGSMDADDVVLGFLVPPGAGKNGIPLQTLFGFERVHVPAGQSLVVDLYPTLTDFTHTLLDGSKVAAPGVWTVRFGVQQTAEQGMGYTELKLTAV